MIDETNFFSRTQAIFFVCKRPKRPANYVSRSKYSYYDKNGIRRQTISSTYWYGEDKKGKFVIRESDHWGCVASCNWGFNAHFFSRDQWCRQDEILKFKCNKKTFSAKAYFKDFKQNIYY